MTGRSARRRVAATRHASARAVRASSYDWPVSSDAGTVRVFYALVPPPDLRRALAEWSRDVARHTHGRPIPAANVHLTLAFIGAWPRARLPALLGVGDAVDADAMRIVLDTVGAFRRAGVAWIAPSETPPALSMLSGSLESLLASNHVAHDARTLHPHVTLARRCRSPYASGNAGPFIWDADSLALMQSEGNAEGMRYTKIAEWRLRAMPG